MNVCGGRRRGRTAPSMCDSRPTDASFGCDYDAMSPRLATSSRSSVLRDRCRLILRTSSMDILSVSDGSRYGTNILRLIINHYNYQIYNRFVSLESFESFANYFASIYTGCIKIMRHCHSFKYTEIYEKSD